MDYFPWQLVMMNENKMTAVSGARLVQSVDSDPDPAIHGLQTEQVTEVHHASAFSRVTEDDTAPATSGYGEHTHDSVQLP